MKHLILPAMVLTGLLIPVARAAQDAPDPVDATAPDARQPDDADATTGSEPESRSRPAPAPAADQRDEAQPTRADAAEGSDPGAKPAGTGAGQKGAAGKRKSPTADDLLGEMLDPPAGQQPAGGRPLPAPEDAPKTDATSGDGAVKPAAPTVGLMREGTFIVDRVGRLTRAPDGGAAEFTFEADGQALQDPPVVIIPNQKLMSMEDAVRGANRDLRFRITGQVTEYRGRNYVLLEKVIVVPEVTQQFRRD